MHFCEANDGCTGSSFKLKRLTDEEQEIQDELNSIFDKPKVSNLHGMSNERYRAIRNYRSYELQ